MRNFALRRSMICLLAVVGIAGAVGCGEGDGTTAEAVQRQQAEAAKDVPAGLGSVPADKSQQGLQTMGKKSSGTPAAGGIQPP